jgi:hypothetical protein
MPDLAATKEIVVLSPPGRIRAQHCDSWAGVRTSRNCHVRFGEEEGSESM